MRLPKTIVFAFLLIVLPLRLLAGSVFEQVVGDYQGEWLDSYEGYGPRKGELVAAQIIDIGRDRYRLRLLPEFDKRCEPFVEIEASGGSASFSFEKGDWKIELTPEGLAGHLLQSGKEVRFELGKVIRLSPKLGLEAPEGADVLFDGSHFEHWRQLDESLDSVAWVLTEEGAMHKPMKNRVKGAKYTLATKKGYRDCKLHLEFRYPWQPEKSGQGKGNSGVFLQGAYEIQILNTYGLPGYYDQCGAFYKTAAPKVNMASPSMQWQSYDIEFYGPRFDDEGNKVKNAVATVYHNGVLIHSQQELPERIGGIGVGEPKGPSPLTLQDHGAPVEYRNMWILELE